MWSSVALLKTKVQVAAFRPCVAVSSTASSCTGGHSQSPTSNRKRFSCVPSTIGRAVASARKRPKQIKNRMVDDILVCGGPLLVHVRTQLLGAEGLAANVWRPLPVLGIWQYVQGSPQAGVGTAVGQCLIIRPVACKRATPVDPLAPAMIHHPSPFALNNFKLMNDIDLHKESGMQVKISNSN